MTRGAVVGARAFPSSPSQNQKDQTSLNAICNLLFRVARLRANIRRGIACGQDLFTCSNEVGTEIERGTEILPWHPPAVRHTRHVFPPPPEEQHHPHTSLA